MFTSLNLVISCKCRILTRFDECVKPETCYRAELLQISGAWPPMNSIRYCYNVHAANAVTVGGRDRRGDLLPSLSDKYSYPYCSHLLESMAVAAFAL